MSPDLGLVRTWQGEPLTAMARRAADAGERLQAELGALLAADLDATTWHGEARAAAARHQVDLLEDVVRLAGAVSALENAFILASGRVQSAGDLARAAAHLAELHGVVVTDSGAILDPVIAPDNLAGTGPHDVEVLVGQALAEADRADADLTTVLAEVARRLLVDGRDGRDGRDETAGVAAGASTTFFMGRSEGYPPAGPPGRPGGTATLSWWSGLSPEARRSAAVDSADLVGATDGIPAWARDQANRVRLRRAERDLTLAADRLRPPSGGGLFDVGGGLAGAATVGTMDGPNGRAAYLQVRGKLAAVQAVAQVLDQADGRRRQLLVFDTSGRSAKAGVAVGDVDRAEHVAVVVPGFTTTVQGDLAGADAAAADLRDVARRESMGWGDRGEVAVVSWLGYDAPQVADSLRTHSVVLRASAEAGATELNPFLRGLPADAHVTVVGHSYGSTTVGLAVAAGGTGVSDLVAIGSPGLGVRSPGALGLSASKVHVIEADGDPVADLGWFGRDPGHLPGVDLLAADARRLADGSTGLASRGHSQYLDPGTTSQWNVAAVVVGVATVPTAGSRAQRVG